MTQPHSEDWHERRRAGIGGSEWGDVLGLDPYGCARRLWYEKRGTELDFPRRYTGAMKRGHKLEALVAEEVTERYGFKFRRKLKIKSQYAMPAWWIGNLDRVVQKGAVPGKEGPGVAEFKTKGPFPFQKLLKTGIPDVEKLQVQHYIGLTGFSWGLYACLEPVSWRLFVQFVDQDNEALALMLKVGEQFMREVEEGPAPFKLMSSDRRCQTCEFRWTCHGEALVDATIASETEEIEDPYLAKLIEERDEIQEANKEGEESLDDNTRKIKEHLGEHRKVRVGDRPIVWKLSTRKSFDSKKLEAEKPDIYEQYVNETSYEYFRVF